MEFLITETQLKTILTEQEKSVLSDYMKQLYSFTKNMLSRVHKAYGLNLRMLATWGTAVGGLILPLDGWIRSGNFQLTDDQHMLILIGVATTLFFESKRPLSKILKIIREEGLEVVYEEGLRKGTELRDAFVDFMKSLKIATGSLIDIVSYSFIIPIISDIQSIASESITTSQAATLIAERLLASGVVVITGHVLVKILKKIINRIK